MKDFQPVANHVQDPGAIFVRTESPYKTLEDLLKDAKARPKQIKASTTGIGSDDHLSCWMWSARRGCSSIPCTWWTRRRPFAGSGRPHRHQLR